MSAFESPYLHFCVPTFCTTIYYALQIRPPGVRGWYCFPGDAGNNWQISRKRQDLSGTIRWNFHTDDLGCVKRLHSAVSPACHQPWITKNTLKISALDL